MVRIIGVERNRCESCNLRITDNHIVIVLSCSHRYHLDCFIDDCIFQVCPSCGQQIDWNRTYILY